MSRSPFEGTGPVAPAHAFDPAVVAEYLASVIQGFAGPMEVAQFAGGQSNPTFLLTTPGASYVLRRKPSGPTLPTAHAVDREFRVTSALSAQGFPVARPLAFCKDPAVMATPFFVMEHVPGRVHWNPRLPDLPPERRRATYEAMAATLATLHCIDIDAAGLGDFGKRGDYFARQIARWSEQYRAARTRPIPAMDHLMEWLGAHAPQSSGRSSIIHGDYRLDNIIFADDARTIRAVIDWELSTLGDPLADLSYQCMLWHLPPGAFGTLEGVDLGAEGLPSESEYRSMYFSRTGASRPDDWEASIVYNLFRLASILEGVARRAIDGNASSRRATEMAALVEPIANRAWEIARRI